MAVINTDIVKISSKCKDVIGVKQLCSTTYPYYLDTLGISLNKAAKLADSSMATARTLIDEALEMGWSDVLSDLRIDGFRVHGVIDTHKDTFLDTLEGSGTFTRSITRDCDVQKIYINSITVKVDGTTDTRLSVIYNGTEYVIYDDTLTDESLIVNINSEIDTDEIVVKVITTGDAYNSDGGGIAVVDYYTKCDESLFLCKYWSYLVKAVMYKTSAHILNSSLFSDRYNDLIIYKKDEIALRVAQLDSSFNLLSKENRINTKGLYQLEIEKINDKLKEIVRQSYCTCCFKCDTIISSSISIP